MATHKPIIATAAESPVDVLIHEAFHTHLREGRLTNEEFKRLQNSPAVRAAAERRFRGVYGDFYTSQSGDFGVLATEEGTAFLLAELCGATDHGTTDYPGGHTFPIRSDLGEPETIGGHTGEYALLGARGRGVAIDHILTALPGPGADCLR